MNLVGHVAAALSPSDADPSSDFLVGCMLPDLAAIARVRLARPAGDLGRGVEFHHACDAVFHDSAWFRRVNRERPRRVARRGCDDRRRAGVLTRRHGDAARRRAVADARIEACAQLHARPPSTPAPSTLALARAGRVAGGAGAQRLHDDRIVARSAPLRRRPVRRRAAAPHDRRSPPHRGARARRVDSSPPCSPRFAARRSRRRAPTVRRRGQAGGPQPPPPGVRMRSTSPGASVHGALVGQARGRGLVAAGEQPVLAHRARRAAGEPPRRLRPALGDERHRRRLRAPRARARCRRRRVRARRRRSPAAARSAARAAAARARAPRPACRACSSSRCARRSCRRPTDGRPARRRSSRSSTQPSPPISTLFIVPWLAAPTRRARACASAPRHTSATRWLTSTLPAPTATGGTRGDDRARRRDHAHRPHRAAVRRDASDRSPARIANATALTVTASTAFTLPGRCASVPVKSNVTSSPSTRQRRRTIARRRLLLAAAGRRSRARRRTCHAPSGSAASAARMRRSP